MISSGRVDGRLGSSEWCWRVTNSGALLRRTRGVLVDSDRSAQSLLWSASENVKSRMPTRVRNVLWKTSYV